MTFDTGTILFVLVILSLIVAVASELEQNAN